MPQLILDPQSPPDREQKNRHHVAHACPLILAHIGRDLFATDHNTGLLESRLGGIRLTNRTCHFAAEFAEVGG